MHNALSKLQIRYIFGFIISLFFFLAPYIQAQEVWDFPAPEINTGQFAISDTIYMSPSGNDGNVGSFDQPVASFGKAISLLPFGEPGVNGGNAYGLIMLVEGVYIVENGFQQNLSQYEQDGTYKNISIEGIGEVTVRGNKKDYESLANGHLIHLRGSHIYIRNVKLKYAKIHGILLSNTEKMSDILVEDVEVDSVSSFSMLCANVENVIVRDSKFLRGSRIFNDDLVSGPDCQWPSGLKFYGSKYVQSINNEVAYTRGEGLNFHNSEYGLAYGNDLHDNSSNIYCDNSARIIIRNNLNYATPGKSVYWKACPADEIEVFGCTGILMANEGACDVGGPVYGNCTTTCALAGKAYKQIDSIFVFNNFFINTTPALSLWQGVTEPVGGPNCLRNIFFEHNTVIGLTGGTSNGNPAAINAFFPNVYNTILGFGYAIGQNIQINANIISLPFDEYPNARICRKTLHDLFPVPFQMTFKDNLINNSNTCGANMDMIVESLPEMVDISLDSILSLLQPCPENQDLIFATEPSDYISVDYLNAPRLNEQTNVGALEYNEACHMINEVDEEKSVESRPFKIFPNPGNGQVTISFSQANIGLVKIKVLSIHGEQLKEKEFHFSKGLVHIDLSLLPQGLYFIQITGGGFKESLRYVKM